MACSRGRAANHPAMAIHILPGKEVAVDPIPIAASPPLVRRVRGTVEFIPFYPWGDSGRLDVLGWRSRVGWRPESPQG